MRILLVLLLLALTAGKIAAVLLRGPVPIELDAFRYWGLSSLVMGDDILMLAEPIAYRTPVYPWFLAIIRSLNGENSLWVIGVVQGILALATVGIAAHIAGRITKLPRAVPWTLLVSVPAVSAFTFSAAVLSETLFVFLLMLNLLAVLDYAKHGTIPRVIWLGVTFSVTLLTRPIVILLWIPHVIFLLYIHIRKRRRLGKNAPGRLKLHHRFVHATIAALTIGVLIAPWLMRNQYLFGRPFLTEFVGRNAWIVTFQDGSGAGLDLPQTESGRQLRQRLANVDESGDWRHTWTVSKALVASGLDDAQADLLMTQVCLDAIESNPQLFGRKAFRRVVNFWRCAATDLPDQRAIRGEFRGHATCGLTIPQLEWVIEHRWSQSVALNTLLTAVLGAATLLLIFDFRTRPYGVWLALILSYFAIVTGILEIPAYRYRIVVEPLVATMIGAAIAVLLSRRRKAVKAVAT
ncbi:MAG: glycosyltransferase family 39 protein [Bythopirellula sp.]